MRTTYIARYTRNDPSQFNPVFVAKQILPDCADPYEASRRAAECHPLHEAADCVIIEREDGGELGIPVGPFKFKTK